jgi:hypothetical protein
LLLQPLVQALEHCWRTEDWQLVYALSAVLLQTLQLHIPKQLHALQELLQPL